MEAGADGMDMFDEPAGDDGDLFDMPTTAADQEDMQDFLAEGDDAGDSPFGDDDAPLDAASPTSECAKTADAFGDDVGAFDEIGDDEAAVPAEDEDSALKKFKAEWAQLCIQKDKEAAEKKAEQEAKARSDLNDFSKQKNDHKEKVMATNRGNEKDFLEQLESAKQGDNPWERVVNMVDTKEDPEGLDISRMRSILIQLKSKPLVSK